MKTPLQKRLESIPNGFTSLYLAQIGKDNVRFNDHMVFQSEQRRKFAGCIEKFNKYEIDPQ